MPLWLLDDEEQSNVGKNTVSAIMEPYKEGVTARSTTLKELRQQSRITGLFTNITDEMINEAVKEDKETVPSPEDIAQQQQQQGEESATSQHERNMELVETKIGAARGNSTE